MERPSQDCKVSLERAELSPRQANPTRTIIKVGTIPCRAMRLSFSGGVEHMAYHNLREHLQDGLLHDAYAWNGAKDQIGQHGGRIYHARFNPVDKI